MKIGDEVVFIKNYNDTIKAGEVHEIDKIIHNGVYIKLDTTWIYLDNTNFNEYCELKPKSFCKIGEDYKKSCDAIDKKLLTETIEQMKKSIGKGKEKIKHYFENNNKKMEKKINIGSRVLGLNLNNLDLSNEYGTVKYLKDGFVTVQFSDNLVSFPEEELLKRNEESMKHITNFINKIPNYSGIEEKKEYDYINPSHYRINGKETFDMMVLIWGVDNAIAHCEMTAFKYRMRAGKKPDQPIQRDLEKAKWYEDKAIQLRNEQK